MKVAVHKAGDRGVGDHGWLTSRFSFSFANWYEPSRMGFGKLRVLNDDIIAPSSGFPPHGHKDMEIVTIVMNGAVTHTDSMGNAGVVRAGEVQAMSAGTGVVHSEMNESPDTPLELFQIWIEPKELGVAPRYSQKAFDFAKTSELVGPKSLAINQDVHMTLAVLKAGEEFMHDLADESHGLFIFMIDGEAEVSGYRIGARDALAISDTAQISITPAISGRALLIEVPL